MPLIHSSAVVKIGFTEESYKEDESQSVICSARISNDVMIASPVTLQVRPLTFDMFLAEGHELLPTLPSAASGKANTFRRRDRVYTR